MVASQGFGAFVGVTRRQIKSLGALRLTMAGTIEEGRFGRAAKAVAASGLCLMLAQCGSASKLTNRLDPKYGVAASPRVVQSGEVVPRGGGTYRVGKPYTVGGRIYTPEENMNYRAEGLASWYGDDFHGRLTANGEVFDMTSISAAHPTMPMPSYARVTNMRNGKSLIVRVNDRGPFHGNRVIDVSHRAAKLLEFDRMGTARVRVEYVGRASLDGSDDNRLLATLREGAPAPAPSTVMVASAKPFVPQVASSLRGTVSGDIPMPEGRPYTLGHTTSDMASVSATSEMTASRRRSARGVTTVADGGDYPGSRYPQAAPVASYAAPAPVSGPALGMRGLY